MACSDMALEEWLGSLQLPDHTTAAFDHCSAHNNIICIQNMGPTLLVRHVRASQHKVLLRTCHKDAAVIMSGTHKLFEVLA